MYIVSQIISIDTHRINLILELKPLKTMQNGKLQAGKKWSTQADKTMRQNRTN